MYFLTPWFDGKNKNIHKLTFCHATMNIDKIDLCADRCQLYHFTPLICIDKVHILKWYHGVKNNGFYEVIMGSMQWTFRHAGYTPAKWQFINNANQLTTCVLVQSNLSKLCVNRIVKWSDESIPGLIVQYVMSRQIKGCKLNSVIALCQLKQSDRC